MYLFIEFVILGSRCGLHSCQYFRWDFDMFTGTRMWCKCLWLFGLCLFLHGASSPAYAEESSSALGGSLLEQGEVAITVGGGFPDLLVQFDFANSKRVNLAMRARLNYNLGFPFFGFHAFLSAPVRISLYRQSKWSVALQLEPGVWAGGGVFAATSVPYGFILGFMVGASGIASYRAHSKVDLQLGLEAQFLFAWEPTATSGFNFSRDIFGVQVPIEAFFGIEYRLNESLSLFGRVAIGPQIYVGNLGKFLAASGLGVSGTGRLWGGVVWRR